MFAVSDGTFEHAVRTERAVLGIGLLARTAHTGL
jgi:hypothetical protein